MKKVRINRLATGIPGLAAVLGGGPPGSGKTTLAHQLMFALATPTLMRPVSRSFLSIWTISR
jgi:circadian clock protein KaiC